MPAYWIEVVGKRWRIRSNNGKIVQPAETMSRAVDARDGANHFSEWCGRNTLEVHIGSQMRVVGNSGQKKKAKRN